MGQIKQRDYMFDAFRGLLIWCIPLSHFTRVAGDYHHAFLSQIVYITINVFVMQAFVFLSGYFSKRPERARETAFHTFLWPYLLCIPFFFMVRSLIFGHATINLWIPPFALWYLFALFFYRFFLKNYIKIPHIFEISMLVYLVAGLVPFFSDKLALGRMLSYFPFFLIGYYCTEEHLKKIRSLKKWHCGILAAVLVAVSVLLAKFATMFPAGYYLLKCPHNELGMPWYWDIIGRMMIFVIACGWIILMLNIIPNKKNYLVYVGMNTMPIYILHLIVRYFVKKYGITFGILPDNRVLYYVLIFVLASLCVVVLSSPPVVKLYDLVVEGLYKVFKIILRAFVTVMGVIHIPVEKIAVGGMNVIEKLGNSSIAPKKKTSSVFDLMGGDKQENAETDEDSYDPGVWFKEKENAEDEADADEPAEEEAQTEAAENEAATEEANDSVAVAEPESPEAEDAPAIQEEPEADEPAEQDAPVAQTTQADESAPEADDEEADAEETEEEAPAEPEMTDEEKAKALEEEKEAYLASLFGKERLAPYVPKETDTEEAVEEAPAAVEEPAAQPAEEDDAEEQAAEEAYEPAEETAEETEAFEEEQTYEEYSEAAKDSGVKDKLLSKFKTDKSGSIKSLFKRSENAEEPFEEPAPREPKEKVVEYSVYGMTQEEVEALMKELKGADAEPEEADNSEETETAEE